MKLYTVDGAMLTETPEIRLGDKIYKVDNRFSTVKRVGKAVGADPENEIEITLKECLGAAAAKEILAADYSISVMREIILMISAAVSDITVEEARARFQDASKK